MFNGLQKKWKVNGAQLILILCTFAIGGSLTGYAARKLMPVLGISEGVLWVIVYVLLITLLWPLAVLLISFPFGQWSFFKGYLLRIGSRLGLVSKQSAVGSQQSAAGKQQSEVSDQAAVSSQLSDNKLTSVEGLPTANWKLPADSKGPLTADWKELPTEVAIFASGAGSNAQKIIDYFRNSNSVKISLIVCNKPGAGVLSIAARENIPVLMIEKERFFHGDAYLPEIKKYQVSFIVLAGFLWKIPTELIRAYSQRIVNIHPALLPDYGGKGMYGHHVHAAVLAAHDRESGITIHYVDEQYDHGAIIFQARCPVYETDTADSLAKRIHQLEHDHYPAVIGQLLSVKA